MSIDIGYFPVGSRPANNFCGPMLRPSQGISLPERYQGLGSLNFCDNEVLGYDAYARAALETLRSSYNPMPTAGVREFGAFFSKANTEYLKAEIKKRSGGNDMDGGEMMDLMINSFTMIQPRSDITDMERRLDFSRRATDSYVAEMNKLVLERAVEEVIQANKLWDFYAQNRNGPSELPDMLDEDTRSRCYGSFYNFCYWLPGEDEK